jgi:aconitate hydratase 2/2-methylisocitrate dehydratase
MRETYLKLEKERHQLGIPPLPLDPEQTEAVCRVLENLPAGQEEFFLNLLRERVSPGVDAAAKVKAEWLERIATKKLSSPVVREKDAIFMLGTMLGGFNVIPLISLLSDDLLAGDAAEALKRIILVYSAFDTIVDMAPKNKHAHHVLTSWAEGEWFLSKPEFPDEITLRVYKVEGETNTDDLSPAKHAWSRPDIPLHALSMGETRFPDGIETIRSFRNEGLRVAFVGDVVGTGSSGNQPRIRSFGI